MTTTEQPKSSHGTVPPRDDVATYTVSAFLAAAGLAEWTPIRVFVVDSPRFVLCPVARAWIDFEIDEQRGVRWFRVTYSLVRANPAEESWNADGLQLICVSPSGIPHHEGMTLGDAALKPQNRCNGYDLAFLDWFARHGWQIHQTPSGISVWTNNDATCPFTVTRGMIERLEWNGYIERIFPPGAASLDYVWAIKSE
jgi:hypothetical protein